LKTITLGLHAITQRILEGPLRAIAGLFTFIGGTVNKINAFFGKGAGWLGLILNYLDDIALVYLVKHPKIILSSIKMLSKLIDVPLMLVKGLFSMLAKSGRLFMPLLKYFGEFSKGLLSFETIGKLLGKVFTYVVIPLMFAWNVFKGIRNLLHDPALMGTKGFLAFNGKLIIRAFGVIFKALWETINSLLFGLPGLIVRGLKWAAEGIFNLLLYPFKKAWQWLRKTFLGKSPSQLGLMILEGIMAVEGLILRALTSPFRRAWEFIKKLPFVSKLFGMHNVAGNISPEAKATMTVEKNKPSVDAKKSSDTFSNVVGGMSDELSKKISAIVDAINGLRDDMKNGKLTSNVYIDSQKLDALMGRRLAYTGQLT
jgi:hypothetical protein